MQYQTRDKSVFEATANTAITPGTAVIVSGTNTGTGNPVVTPSTSDTDLIIGVAMANYPPTTITSGSLFNVASSGIVIDGKLGSAVNCGGTLFISGSLTTFFSGSRTITATTTSGSGTFTTTMANVFPQFDAIALIAGSTNDIIPIVFKS